MKYALLLIAFVALSTSCKKEPGIGGDAEIRGQVWSYQVSGNGSDTLAEYAAKDAYVYIAFGDNTGFDKRVKTDYNGNYRFSYLYPGDYTLYVYSYDPDFDEETSNGYEAIIKKVTIKKRKEEIELDRFEIFE